MILTVVTLTIRTRNNGNVMATNATSSDNIHSNSHSNNQYDDHYEHYDFLLLLIVISMIVNT